MKTYEITKAVSSYEYFTVVAENEEEAKTLANDMVATAVSSTHSEVVDIQEIN